MAINRWKLKCRFQRSAVARRDLGFSLLEVLIAMVILTIGIVALLALFAGSLATMNLAQKDLIANQKMQDALESIYSARNTGQTTFDSVQNVANGGVFVAGPQPLLDPGPDGLLGTADDDATKPDELILPGPDGVLGTSDDVKILLTDYKRQILISPVYRASGAINPDIRQILVTVTYPSPELGIRVFKVTGFISRFR